MKKILLVEDDADIRILIARQLSKAGYEVISAADAYQGIVFTTQKHPDLILLDMMLPAGGGLTTLKRVRELPSSMLTPVIILTASRDDMLLAKAFSYGVENIIHKPWDEKNLLEKIKKALHEA